MTFDEFMQDSTTQRMLNAYRIGESTAVSNTWRIAADSFVPTITSSSITINGSRDPWKAWAGTYDTTFIPAPNDYLNYERIYTGKYINGVPDRRKEPETFDTDGVKGFLDGIEVNDDR